jgi:hypothetical protein
LSSPQAYIDGTIRISAVFGEFRRRSLIRVVLARVTRAQVPQ